MSVHFSGTNLHVIKQPQIFPEIRYTAAYVYMFIVLNS